MVGIVTDGPYKGQRFGVENPKPAWELSFPGWRTVILEDEAGDRAVRDVREKFLEFS